MTHPRSPLVAPMPLAAHPCMVSLLRAWAERQGDRPAVTMLADAGDESLSYAELDKAARRVAAGLQARLTPGARVLLAYPQGLAFVVGFWGCLYAGMVAVPAYPPRHNAHGRRLQAIVEDAGAALVLAPQAWGELPCVTVEACGAEGWVPPALGPADVAFLQYTSGSTGTPKGVVVTHGNLLANQAMIQAATRTGPDAVLLAWVPLHHDLGLISFLLHALYAGARCLLMAPTAFLQDPARWLTAIAAYGVTHTGGPNFGYEHCLKRVPPERVAGLDLSKWRVAVNAAEPVRADTLDRFAAAYGPLGFDAAAFTACYGLAEATVFATAETAPRRLVASAAALGRGRLADPADAGDAKVLVSCGGPQAGGRVAIVADGVACGPGEVGEIWLAGPHVARGYWGRTAADFGATLAGDARPWLRTGDLGLLLDGALYVTGRLKDLIVVRGLNHYPQDIEWTVERCHPALKPAGAAAFGVEVAGEERLVVVAEAGRHGTDRAAVVGAIRAAVAADHDLHVHAVKLLVPAALPRTSSGKVQRAASRAGFLAGSLRTLEAP